MKRDADPKSPKAIKKIKRYFSQINIGIYSSISTIYNFASKHLASFEPWWESVYMQSHM